ncbi:MAG: 6,7-dimethyl-8-ribityllumazine synthase, partial [Alphaproteobacteria bacterium]|nr:6,7-dimethyl-8-ribityllumazine synthase [Alphaproteobacteria bacterium]
MLKLPPDCAVLIVLSPYYPQISEALHQGAIAVLQSQGVSYKTIEVTGALEIPAAIAMVYNHYHSERNFGKPADIAHGHIALGCV